MVEKEENILKIHMPVTKTESGTLKVLVTDTSLDRHGTFMSESFIDDVITKDAVVGLIDHDNSMKSWVGGFRNIEKEHKEDHFSATAEPWFFTNEANPLAGRIQKQIEEALDMGLNPCVSIGARGLKSETKKIDGKVHKIWTRGELLEVTWTPIGANKNSYAYIANSFGLKTEKRIISKKKKELIDDFYKKMEVLTMSEEEKKEPEGTEGGEETPKEPEGDKSEETPKDGEKAFKKEPEEEKDKKKAKEQKSFSAEEINKIVNKKVNEELSNRESFLKALGNHMPDGEKKVVTGQNYLERALEPKYGGTK